MAIGPDGYWNSADRVLRFKRNQWQVHSVASGWHSCWYGCRCRSDRDCGCWRCRRFLEYPRAKVNFEILTPNRNRKKAVQVCTTDRKRYRNCFVDIGLPNTSQQWHHRKPSFKCGIAILRTQIGIDCRSAAVVVKITQYNRPLVHDLGNTTDSMCQRALVCLPASA
jgi:hypothetical protein